MSNLHEHTVKEWVSALGVAVPRGATAAEPEAVEAAAKELTPPLVVKAYGPGLIHKSDAGAVRLGIATPREAAGAAAEIRAALPAGQIAGFLVEEQAEAGVEVIVGAVQDPAFGPVVLVGLGGVWTEVLHDTALRLAPITADDAREMLGELKGGPLLDGFRGAPGIDREALVEVLLAVGGPDGVAERLAGTSAEFELNPVICGPTGAIAVDARLVGVDRIPAHSPEKSAQETINREFGRLFEPRGIAVVGASTKRPNFGNMFLRFYQGAGFADEKGGKLVAVHPEAAEIDGVPCIKSLAEAEGIDYALVAVPAKQCAAVVRQARGIPFVQVMSSGFREMGEAALEAELVAAAREAGVRLLGPNCMGVYSPRGGQTFIGGTQGQPGSIAVISQSGGMAGEVIKVGEQRGLRYSMVATVGNSADVTPAELLRSFGDEVSAVGLYLEDPRDGRGLYEALRATRHPVVALVGGRSGQGRRAAASHTGGMVSDTRVWAALARQTGITLVTGQDDLIGVLDLLDLHGRRDAPGTDEVLVIGPSGGASVLAADVFDAAGLNLASFPDPAVQALRAMGLGAGTSLANPLEIPLGPLSPPDLVKKAVQAILQHRPYADVVAHVNAQSFFTYGSAEVEPLIEYARGVGRLQAELARTRVTLVMRNAECAPAGVEAAVREAAREAGIPLYRNMESAAVAIAAVKTHARSRRHGAA